MQAIIIYNAPRKIDIGDVFYRIIQADFAVIKEPCKMCGDSKQITINGITEKCPHCGSGDELLRINNFIVARYRVYSIKDEVDADDWKASTRHRVKFGLYRKVGCGNYSWNHHECVELYESAFANLNNGEWYDDYSVAVKAAKALVDQQLELLREFNESRGTAHVAAFKSTNDPKSK